MPRRPLHAVRRAAAGLALALLSGCATAPGGSRAALDSAGRFLMGLQNPRLHVDGYWLFQQALPHRPGWAAAPVFARPAAERFRGDPCLRLLDRSHAAPGLSFERVAQGDPAWPYRVPPAFAEQVYTPYDRALLRALYADVGDFGAEDIERIRTVARGDGGYADTHALMALLLVIAQGRDVAGAAQAEADRLCRLLAAAADAAEQFDDVFPERIVFLYWAGHGDLVKPAWIARILAAQRPDGAWGSDRSQGYNLHTTALAVLALLYHDEGRPQQPLYPP